MSYSLRKQKYIIVGRLSRECYMQGDSLIDKCKFTVLKRKSTGSLQDCVVDAAYDIPTLRMHTLPEGLYELRLDVTSIDIESGYADDWEIKLIKLEEDGNE